jgi:hypothetical protein
MKALLYKDYPETGKNLVACTAVSMEGDATNGILVVSDPYDIPAYALSKFPCDVEIVDLDNYTGVPEDIQIHSKYWVDAVTGEFSLAPVPEN